MTVAAAAVVVVVVASQSIEYDYLNDGSETDGWWLVLLLHAAAVPMSDCKVLLL